MNKQTDSSQKKIYMQLHEYIADARPYANVTNECKRPFTIAS